jgi:drug/metabolite transporter (DMT)-like permease
MPLADATAISFLNPVFCMLLAIPFLGERPGPWRWTAAAISLGGAVVLLRPGGEAVSAGALLALGAAALAVWQAPTAAQWGAMAALGFCMAAAQGFFTNALARADASFVTPLSYLTLVFAGLYDLALFGVVPDAVGWAGAALILAGALLLAWREGRARPARVRT